MKRGHRRRGSRVSLCGERGVEQTVKTGAHGEFSVISVGSRVLPAVAMLVARSNDRAASVLCVRVPQEPGELKMQLTAPVIIEGTVRSDSGAPIAASLRVIVYF